MSGAKRIIFSSTRGWNPGDEFILEGIRNVLRAAGVEFVEILYNRHPLVRTGFGGDKLLRGASFLLADNPDLQVKKLKNGKRIMFMDNSFYPVNERVADYIIFAGTPEWAGKRNRELYKYALKHKIRGALLGVGLKNEITDVEREYLSNYVDTIVTRDSESYEQLKEFGAIKGVCPALFSAGDVRKVEGLNRVGIVFQGTGLWANSISVEIFDKLVPVYNQILKEFSGEIICHHFADYVRAVEIFGYGAPTYYTSNWRDLLNHYRNFDIVIGTRLHGIGAASSWGIPGILIAHDDRTKESGSFLEIIVEPEQVISVVRDIDVVRKSVEIIEHKERWFAKYIDLSRNFLL